MADYNQTHLQLIQVLSKKYSLSIPCGTKHLRKEHWISIIIQEGLEPSGKVKCSVEAMPHKYLSGIWTPQKVSAYQPNKKNLLALINMPRPTRQQAQPTQPQIKKQSLLIYMLSALCLTMAITLGGILL